MASITNANDGVFLLNQFVEITPEHVDATTAYSTWATELGVSDTISYTPISDGDDKSTGFNISNTRSTFQLGGTSYVSHTTEGGWSFYFNEPSVKDKTLLAILGSGGLNQEDITRWYSQSATQPCLTLSFKVPSDDSASKNSKWQTAGNVVILYSVWSYYSGLRDFVNVALKIDLESSTWEIVVSDVTSADNKFQVFTLRDGSTDNQATGTNGGQIFDLVDVHQFKSAPDVIIPLLQGSVKDSVAGVGVESVLTLLEKSTWDVFHKLTTEPDGTFEIPIRDYDTVIVFAADGLDTGVKDIIGGDDSDIELLYNNTGVAPPPTDPTHTSIISGNVQKLGLPYLTQVVAVSVHPSNPTVLATTLSDSITGDYSMDVEPWLDEVVIYTTPDYGNEWFTEGEVTVGDVIHPTVPNGYVYKCDNSGTLGAVEPTWLTDLEFISGNVALIPEILYKPLINGFVKPVVTPI